ncbi:MAG: YIP1 family protein [Candidatus Aenigmatarchaeota archaeon]
MEDMNKWVNEKLDEGYPEEKIKQAMIEEGYEGSMIESMFNSIKEERSQKSDMTWFQVFKEVFVHPKKFFRKMPTKSGYGAPFKFLLVSLAIFGLIFGSIFIVLFTSILSIISNFIGLGSQLVQLLSGIGFIGIPLFILFIMFFGVIYSFVWTSLAHLMIKLFGGNGNYEGTFRVTSYTSIFIIFGWVPILNIALIFYGFYVMLVGYSVVHKVSKIKTLFAILLPIVLIFFVVFGGYTFIGSSFYVPESPKFNNTVIQFLK